MTLDRRTFLASGVGGGTAMATMQGATAAEPSGELPRSKNELSTPALVVDVERLDANIATMAAHLRSAGKNLRPHAKTHKCPEIARRQLAAGAIGICVATVPEAEALAAAGISGLLLTSPVVEPHKIARLVRLVAGGASVMASVGDEREAQLLAEATAAAGCEMNLLIDVDAGDHRTGCAPGEAALSLARKIAAHRQLHVVGVQSYSGSSSHVVGFAERTTHSHARLAGAIETRQLLQRSGFEARILSVGSTGTYNIDSVLADVTELQCGSYVVMDVDYRSIGGREGAVYADFQPSLSLVATVVRDGGEGRVTIDAGTKAIDTTTKHLPAVVGRPDLVYSRGGDEFGFLASPEGGSLPKLGERVEFVVPHCDPSIHLHDRLYACRGERVEAAWPILARREFPAIAKTLLLLTAIFLGASNLASAAEPKSTPAATAKTETAASLTDRAAAVVAQLEGALELPGLREPVEILRDRWGVPHIYARNDHDLFFAQGFTVAQDRLFQLDVWRRTAIGETAALVGEKGLAGDRFARLMKYRGPADAEWTSYSPDARRIAESFTAGINACIDSLGDRLPIEFRLLNYAPAKWRPEDVLGRMSGLIMVRNYDDEAARAELIAAVGVENARRICPTDPVRDFAPVPGLDLAGIDRKLLAGYEAATAPLPLDPVSQGSNNWAVAGSRSASGKPLLAGDPHRTIMLPSLRYLVHLNAPGWNVIGAGEPALPGVAIGHNERVAWAFTIVNTDQADLYVEEINPADATQYKVADSWEKLTIVRESAVVRGRAEPVELELKFTRHGPVIHEDAERNRAYVLRWVGSEPGAAAYLASLRLDRVQNAKQFVDELAAWKVPALNMVFADVDGNIGWVAAGGVPIRDGWDGLLPVPGAGGKYEWRGFRPVAELPQSHNPPSGYVATANHNILPTGYPHAISYEWSTPYRFEQIKRRLDAQPKFTLDDFRSIQHDATSIPGQELVALLREISARPATLESLDAACVKLLLDWDGVLSVDSRAGVLYGYWIAELSEAVYGPQVPAKLLGFAQKRGGMANLLAVLKSADPAWFTGGDPREVRDAVVTKTLSKAIERAKQKFPDYPQRGTWGELHTTTFSHLLSRLGPEYAKALDLGPVPKSGDSHTPNAASHNSSFRQTAGASYRQVFDLADWDRGLATSVPGQSGQPTSPHYGDLLPLWAGEEYFPLAFSRAKVESFARHRLVLQPATKR